MENKIPQKSFDEQMHIIRDVHFDVDKYKIDELYVIKHKITNAHTIDGKMVGKLIKANAHALTFDIFTEVIPEGILPTDPHNYYGITTITLLLDDIIEKKIEIERLMTETEAVVYVTSAIAKECAKDIIPEPINRASVADTYKGDLSCFVPLKPTAAYRNDDAFDRFMRSEPITVNIGSESTVDTNINRLNYTYCTPGNSLSAVSFICSDGSFAYKYFERFKESIKVDLRSGETAISFKTSPKNITADGDTISIRNGNGTIKTVLHKDSFYKVFDIIRFES